MPQYEEREAAIFGQYNWTDWRGLDWHERASVVAHFRVHRQIDLHQNDAMAREMKNRSRKANRGNR